jgi:hypothetical protein
VHSEQGQYIGSWCEKCGSISQGGTARVPEGTIGLNRLVEDVGSWATHNFGNQPPSYPLSGAIEETGELAEAYLNLYQNSRTGIDSQMMLLLDLQAHVGKIAHSILKRKQGIREDDPDVGIEAQREQIQVASIILQDLADYVEEPHDGGEVDLMCVPEPDEELVDAVADVVIYLADFSYRAGINLDTTVWNTWRDVVSDRDWDSDLGDS